MRLAEGAREGSVPPPGKTSATNNSSSRAGGLKATSARVVALLCLDTTLLSDGALACIVPRPSVARTPEKQRPGSNVPIPVCGAKRSSGLRRSANCRRHAWESTQYRLSSDKLSQETQKDSPIPGQRLPAASVSVTRELATKTSPEFGFTGRHKSRGLWEICIVVSPGRDCLIVRPPPGSRLSHGYPQAGRGEP